LDKWIAPALPITSRRGSQVHAAPDPRHSPSDLRGVPSLQCQRLGLRGASPDRRDRRDPAHDRSEGGSQSTARARTRLHPRLDLDLGGCL